MSVNSAITIPKTAKAKILAKTKNKLRKDGQEISSKELMDLYVQVESIIEIMIDEMAGSKNKYLIEYAKENGYNNL